MGGRRQALQPPTLRLWLLSLAAVALASFSAGATAHCLARLDTHPAEFDDCKSGTFCFLFLAEPPMVHVEGVVGAAPPTSADDPPGIRTPFPCANAGKQFGLSGASFDLHGATGLWPSNSDLCVYAGSPEECTFTAMVAYLPNVKKPGHPAYGMALGTAGMLVQVDKRLDWAVPSIPIYEDQLFLVQRKKHTVEDRDIRQLFEPLNGEAWLAVGMSFLVLYSVIACLSLRYPHVLNGDHWLSNLQLWFFNFLRNTVGGELSSREVDWATARGVLLSTPWVLVAIVLIFYEGVFIAEQLRPTLSTSIRGRNLEHLCHFTVKIETATEDVFLQLANMGSPQPINLSALATERERLQVWNSCNTIKDCLQQVARADANPYCPRAGAAQRTTDYYVTWGAAVRFAFHQDPDLCDRLEAVDLRADVEGDLPIQQFNLGWMFANLTREEHEAAAVPLDAAISLRAYQQLVGRHNEINAGFLRGRMRGATRATSRYFGAKNIPCAPSGGSQIVLDHVLFPLAIVLLVALLLTLLMCTTYPVLVRHAADVDKKIADAADALPAAAATEAAAVENAVRAMAAPAAVAAGDPPADGA